MAKNPTNTDDNSRALSIVGRVGGWTRFIILVPVLGLLVGALALVALGAVETVSIITSALSETAGTKETLVAFIELADLFLLAVVLYMISLGLFELFIDSDLKLPAWLRFNSFDDLKHQLVGVVIVVLGVLFLGQAIKVKDAQELFWIGAATALVIVALSYFLRGKAGRYKDSAEKTE